MANSTKPPHSSVVICATPRSGSYLLCEALENTGRCGHAEEFLWPRTREETATEWGVDPHDTDHYLSEMFTRGTSDNGVFAIKLMWGYLELALETLRSSRPDLPRNGILPTISAAFPNPTFIWMQREDTVRQAVSFAVAAQTDVWRVRDGSTPNAERDGLTLVYDFDEIDYFKREVEFHNDCWRHLFEAAEVDPICVTYESLVESYEETALRCLQGAAIETSGVTFAPRTMKRQSTSLNGEWAARYRQDAESRLQRGEKSPLQPDTATQLR